MEIGKIQILVTRPDTLQWEDQISGMLVRYLNLLPHVAYREHKMAGLFSRLFLNRASDIVSPVDEPLTEGVRQRDQEE